MVISGPTLSMVCVIVDMSLSLVGRLEYMVAVGVACA